MWGSGLRCGSRMRRHRRPGQQQRRQRADRQAGSGEHPRRSVEVVGLVGGAGQEHDQGDGSEGGQGFTSQPTVAANVPRPG